jgi:hypothetical protein
VAPASVSVEGEGEGEGEGAGEGAGESTGVASPSTGTPEVSGSPGPLVGSGFSVK